MIWAPYRRDPLWPALVRNSYPKKITYVFFPLPGDGSEAAFKKVPTFSCLPKSVRALAIDDVVPPNTKNDLKEAFDAAVQYLKAKGLTKGSTAPLSIHANASNAPEDIGSTVVQSESKESTPSTAEEPTKESEETKPNAMSFSSVQELVTRQCNEGKETEDSASVTEEAKEEETPPPKPPAKRKHSEDNSCLAKRQPLPSSPPSASAFAADSTTHSDTSPSPDLLTPIVFNEAISIVEHVWSTDLVQNYVTPPRAGLRVETHTGGLLTDHEIDTLFDLIFCWVREHEKDTYYLPGFHLVLEVLMPEVIIQSLMQARGISRDAAERIVRSTPLESVPSCSSSTSSELNCTNSPKSAANNGNHKSGGSLDELARIACKERESITE